MSLAYAGEVVHLGHENATDEIRSDLVAWCRVATRHATAAHEAALTAQGPLAALVLSTARAYL